MKLFYGTFGQNHEWQNIKLKDYFYLIIAMDKEDANNVMKNKFGSVYSTVYDLDLDYDINTSYNNFNYPAFKEKINTTKSYFPRGPISLSSAGDFFILDNYIRIVRASGRTRIEDYNKVNINSLLNNNYFKKVQKIRRDYVRAKCFHPSTKVIRKFILKLYPPFPKTNKRFFYKNGIFYKLYENKLSVHTTTPTGTGIYCGNTALIFYNRITNTISTATPFIYEESTKNG